MRALLGGMTAAAAMAFGAAPALANTTTIDDVSAGYVTATGASISASVTPDADDQTVTVHYGTSATSLTQTASAGTVYSGYPSTVVATLGGLNPSTTYYFDVVSGAAGDSTPVTSATGSFVTLVRTTPGAKPNVASAIGYLTSSTNLSGGSHYQGPYGADYGDTINAALGLAAAGSDNSDLANIVAYLQANGSHYAGPTADYGPSPGASGKLALLAEAVGANPRSFAGQDLIGELDSYVCAATSASCAGPGAYQDVYSTFSQAFGILAQLRAGDSAGAASPVTYLESLQEDDGAWPSDIPASGDSDVDSSAMAVMALSLASGASASTAVSTGDAFIASRQAADGGFAGASGDSVNSTALALMALGLQGSTYANQIGRGLEFLAAQQNADGGFNIADGQSGSDLFASSQALSGAIGTSLSTVLDSPSATGTSTSSTTTSTPTTTTTTTTTTSTTSTTTSRTTSSTHTTTPTPTLTHVAESNRTWRPSRKLASLARKLPPIGTTFSFRLNETANVTFTFTRKFTGREVGSRCETATRSNRGHPRCSITLTGTLTVHGARAGADRVKFYGRLSRHLTLPAGSWTVTIAASTAGRTSSRHRLTFTIA